MVFIPGNLPLSVALIASQSREKSNPPETVTPLLDPALPADAAITVGETFYMAINILNDAELEPTRTITWYETTSGSPVRIDSHEGELSWTSAATTTAGTRSFRAEVINYTEGSTSKVAYSRVATVTISEAE